MSDRRCAAKNKQGKPCGMPPQEGKDFCYIHDPARAKERAESRKLGGKHRKRRKVADPPEELDLGSVAGVAKLLEVAARDLLALDNGLGRSRAMAYIANVSLKAIEVGELEERLEVVEALLGEQRSGTGA